MRISDWSSDVCSSDLVKCRKALLPIQQNAHSTLLIIVLVRAFKFRRIVCLPSQHCTGGIFLNQGVYQLLCVVTLPHIFTLKSRNRSEEHTSELQSLMRISYAVFCLKKTKTQKITYKIVNK